MIQDLGHGGNRRPIVAKRTSITKHGAAPSVEATTAQARSWSSPGRLVESMDSTSTSRSLLNSERLYLLGDDLDRNALRVGTDVALDPYALLRAEYRPTQPIVFRQSLGRTIGDVIGTGHGVIFLVSDRFIATLTNHRFTGWTTFPIEILLINGSPLPGFHGFAVTGRCGRVDRSRGERVIVPPTSPRGHPVAAVRGVYCDVSKWDGTEVFVPQADGNKRPAYVFVLESVKEAIERAHLTNVSLQRSTDVEEIVP